MKAYVRRKQLERRIRRKRLLNRWVFIPLPGPFNWVYDQYLRSRPPGKWKQIYSVLPDESDGVETVVMNGPAMGPSTFANNLDLIIPKARNLGFSELIRRDKAWARAMTPEGKQ